MNVESPRFLPSIAFVYAIGASAFVAAAALDGLLAGSGFEAGRMLRVTDPAAARDILLACALASAVILAAVFAGLSVLAASSGARWSPRLAESLAGDATTRVVLAVQAGAVLLGLAGAAASGAAAQSGWLSASVWLALAAAGASLGCVAPMFGQAARRLLPERLAESAAAAAVGALGSVPADREGAERRRDEFLAALSRGGHAALAAVAARDGAAATAAMRAVGRAVAAAQDAKKRLSPHFFTADERGFFFLDPPARARITVARTIAEHRAGRELQLCFSEAATALPEAAFAAAETVRAMGERALRNGDVEGLRIASRHLNSMLRAALTLRSPRLLAAAASQQRMLGESCLSAHPAIAADLALYLRYYALAAEDAGLTRAVAVVAFEMAELVRRAAAEKHPIAGDLLDTAISLESRLRERRAGASRIETIRILALLGASLLGAGADDLARRLQSRLRQSPGISWTEIRDDLLADGEPEYWEASDRMSNLEYVDDERRERLREFLAEGRGHAGPSHAAHGRPGDRSHAHV